MGLIKFDYRTVHLGSPSKLYAVNLYFVLAMIFWYKIKTKENQCTKTEIKLQHK